MIKGFIECSETFLASGIPYLKDHQLSIYLYMLFRELEADGRIGSDGKTIFDVA